MRAVAGGPAFLWDSARGRRDEEVVVVVVVWGGSRPSVGGCSCLGGTAIISSSSLSSCKPYFEKCFTWNLERGL